MDLIFSKIAERQLEFATLPDNVKIWVQFMRVWFFAGIFFVVWWPAARWVIAAMVATAIGIIATKILLPSVNSLEAGSLIQLVLWIPLAIYLARNIRPNFLPQLHSARFTSVSFSLWALGSTLIVFISTALNIKNVFDWMP